MSLLAKRRESDPENYRHSLVLLSSEFYVSLTIKLHNVSSLEFQLSLTNNCRLFQTKLNVEWKRIIEADTEAESSFDALTYECPADWIEYACGDRPGWGQPWWLYTQVSWDSFLLLIIILFTL